MTVQKVRGCRKLNFSLFLLCKRIQTSLMEEHHKMQAIWGWQKCTQSCFVLQIILKETEWIE